MSIKIIPAVFFAAIIGFLLGCIPVLNQHLHWNLFYVIPISGLLFGCAIGGVQFGYSFKVDQKITGSIIAVLAVAALIGYFAVDYGIYTTSTIIFEGDEEIPDGEYKLSELITFWQYMKLNLEGTTVEKDFGDELEIGSAWTKISYAADMIGAALGAVAVLFFCSQYYPFCINCARYKKREKEYKAMFKYEEQQTNEIFDKMKRLIEAGSYRDIVAYCRQLADEHNERKGDMKINMDQRYCPMCLEATILGRVYKKSGGNWVEDKEFKFNYTSQAGEHSALVIL
ncbi:MAG: hypothetical protein ACYTE8_02165 [Planctomycetota bacterium]|jgi:hypothetical protein